MKTLITDLVLLTTLGAFLLGCSAERVAKSGDKVKVHYTGKLEDGSIFDSSRDREPFELTIGSGSTIPGFESAIVGMAIGDTITITILPVEAYGPKREDLFITIGRDQIPQDMTPVVGQPLQMQDPNGNIVNVTITDVRPDSVSFDANHPLAGKILIFEIELIEIS